MDANSQLAREVRWLRRYVALLTLALAVVTLGGAKGRPVEEISVRRINVVDADGRTRLLLAGQDDFPPPILDGRVYPRKVAPAGLVFYDRKGNEVGGLALTDVEAGKVSALAFDYPNMDAIGLVTRVGPDGTPLSSGLQINQQPPRGQSVLEASRKSTRRIVIQNESNNAEVLLADGQGRERIRLRVDQQDQAVMEILDGAGKVVFRAP